MSKVTLFPRQSDVPSVFFPSSHPDKALLTTCSTDPRDGLGVAAEPSLNSYPRRKRG